VTFDPGNRCQVTLRVPALLHYCVHCALNLIAMHPSAVGSTSIVTLGGGLILQRQSQDAVVDG